MPNPLPSIDLDEIEVELVEQSHKLLMNENSILYLGGKFLDEDSIQFAANIASRTDADWLQILLSQELEEVPDFQLKSFLIFLN